MATPDELLAAAIPANVREVCRVLTAAGHQAVTVGGAVRDALLGKPPGDWDVATSAHPDQVIALFRHTIPTGLAHGTVTIVTGRGPDSHVEVTTFRGEGAYSDARRPDHVVFGVPLVEDLARRDLRVNAMAYDPATAQLIDPFGGQRDLADKMLRAVGPTGDVYRDAVARFSEDGLRVMRAMRFAAQLEFELDPDTERGIVPALPSLAKVSRERMCEELRKTLVTREPSRGLRIFHRTGMIAIVVPELDAHLRAAEPWLARIDRAKPEVRLAALVVPMSDPEAEPHHVDRAAIKRVQAALRALKFSNAEADVAAQLVGAWRAAAEPEWTPPEVRRLLADLDRDNRPLAIELWCADAVPNAALVAEATRVLAERQPLAVGDLAVTGKDVMTALELPPGPAVGRILALLLGRVLEDPAFNTREALLVAAQQLELEVGR